MDGATGTGSGLEGGDTGGSIVVDSRAYSLHGTSQVALMGTVVLVMIALW